MSGTNITAADLLAQMRAMAEQAQSVSTQNAGQVPGANDNQVDFSKLLKQSVDKVNETQQQANQLAVKFQQGDPNIQLSEVMVAMQKSSVSFQSMLQARNKLIQAYKEVMNMPV